MSVLTDREIIREYNNRNIIISPYDETKINNASVDVSLGEYYYSPNIFPYEVYDPSNSEHLLKRWNGPFKAEYSEEYKSKIIIIPAQQTFLCHTEEFIGTLTKHTTMMKSKSSSGRSCISTCMCAGLGDIGYFNRWTMEIQNHNEIPVVLKVGKCYSQIVFLSTLEPSRTYSEIGRYQISNNVEEVIALWKPEYMLPKI